MIEISVQFFKKSPGRTHVELIFPPPGEYDLEELRSVAELFVVLSLTAMNGANKPAFLSDDQWETVHEMTDKTIANFSQHDIEGVER